MNRDQPVVPALEGEAVASRNRGRNMNDSTYDRLVEKLSGSLVPADGKVGLLFDRQDLVELRARASAHPDLRDRVIGRAREIVDAGDLCTEPEPYYGSLPLLEPLVGALMLDPSDEIAAHAASLVQAVADAPTWICHVHGSMRCDHCAANTAAALARAADVLGPALDDDARQRVVERTWDLCLGPFLEVCRERSLFWAQREHPFNWRIMTCGDTGLAALAFPGEDRLEAVSYAFEGVADILDRVPEDGGWEEGPRYWAETLFYGLRFAFALRRYTNGAIDLFEHPALTRTAEFFTAVTLPDGTVFNYADNQPTIHPTALHIIAGHRRLGHLAWTARRMSYTSVWDILFDDPSVEAEEPCPDLQVRSFATTGIAVSRNDWSEEAVFVGFKSGPTAVGHSHLDIQSFVIQKGNVPLVIDPGKWPYGSAIGFFDSGARGRRWEFDANATVGHNSVLVDGQGQTPGSDMQGRFVASGVDGALRYFVSDGASVYPGLVTVFDRWLVHLVPDVVIVYDRLESDEERRWEWLVHPAGKLSGGKTRQVIENGDARLSLTRLLPAADTPWRNVAETRTSYYQDSDFFTNEELPIVGQRMGPMLPSTSVEFLWVLEVNGTGDEDWQLDRDGDDILVHSPSRPGTPGCRLCPQTKTVLPGE